jgi:hypothetical protein
LRKEKSENSCRSVIFATGEAHCGGWNRRGLAGQGRGERLMMRVRGVIHGHRERRGALRMKGRYLFVAALAFVALADAAAIAAPAFAPIQSPTMPPRRTADCITYMLLDNKCTADWYRCTTTRGLCVRAWTECCSLPGNKARTTIVTAPQTP